MKSALIYAGKNRYGCGIYFYRLEENKFHFFILEKNGTEDELGWRIIGDENGMENITAVDPSGGPYIAVGSTIPDTDQQVIKIENEKDRGFVLITKTKE